MIGIRGRNMVKQFVEEQWITQLPMKPFFKITKGKQDVSQADKCSRIPMFATLCLVWLWEMLSGTVNITWGRVSTFCAKLISERLKYLWHYMGHCDLMVILWMNALKEGTAFTFLGVVTLNKGSTFLNTREVWQCYQNMSKIIQI